MSARITIQSGISAGTSHRIERAVARVGSDPQSDVCLPSANVPAHALTLEFRQGCCRVYNRCRDSVYIGTQVVAPDEVVEWPETDILQLTDNIELLLDFDTEDSAIQHNSGWPENADVDEPSVPSNAQPSDQSASNSGNSKTIIQLMVTVICVLGCVGLLMRDQARKSLPADAPKFSELVASALETGASGELLQRLQYAESLVVRGSQKEASTRFAAIRDDLLPQLDTMKAADRQQELAMLKFVETRLAELQ